MPPSAPAGDRFTQEDREKAQLPSPPAEGSDVEILLRPGLLADTEIIVERIPDVISIPYQGVYQIGGSPVVYVWDGNQFRSRKVTLGKRAESRIAIAEGLEQGELIALENPDPEARRERQSRRKKAQDKGASGPALPGGGGGAAPAGGGGPGGGGRGGGRAR
jgi:hypothetical protein